MVKQLSEYPWSSHAAYLGEEVLPWLESETVLARFAPQLNRARERYAEFISDGINESHRTEFHCGTGDSRVIGDDAFAAKVMAGRSNGDSSSCKLWEGQASIA